MSTYYGLGIITNVVGISINEPVPLDEEGWKNAFQRTDEVSGTMEAGTASREDRLAHWMLLLEASEEGIILKELE